MDLEPERIWRVPYPGIPGWGLKVDADGNVLGREELLILLESKLYVAPAGQGFGSTPSVYPVTVVPARYGGSYEGGGFGGLWLAFPVSLRTLCRAGSGWEDWDASDIECMQWWDRANSEDWPIGRGPDPGTAYWDLIVQVAEKAGLNPEELRIEPGWPQPDAGAGE